MAYRVVTTYSRYRADGTLYDRRFERSARALGIRAATAEVAAARDRFARKGYVPIDEGADRSWFTVRMLLTVPAGTSPEAAARIAGWYTDVRVAVFAG